MSAKERTDIKALEKRISELEKQLERIPSTNLVLPDDLRAPNFAPCEKIRKPVRQLTDIVKKKPARPIDGCTLP